MATVAQVLKQKYPQFNTVSPDHFVSDALYQMCCENVDYLIVLKEGKFVGILSEHDVAHKLLFVEKPLSEIKVADFMNKSLPVATSSDSVDYAMQLLERYKTQHVAIFDKFDFKGIVSTNDLMKQALSSRKAAFEEVPQNNSYPWNY